MEFFHLIDNKSGNIINSLKQLVDFLPIWHTNLFFFACNFSIGKLIHSDSRKQFNIFF